MKYDRVRFKADKDDYRPVIWPPLGPYWCSGFGHNYNIVVAYFPEGTVNEEIEKYWPEVEDLDTMEERVDIEYSDRFAEPEWWSEIQNAKKD